MRGILIISYVVAAVFNRGQLKSSSATPSPYVVGLFFLFGQMDFL